MKARILSILIVFAIVIGFLPQNAFAIDEKNRTYVYNTFTVDYNITDSWADTQNITVYVTNTGIEPIENWMLAYDFKGEVYDIWNAEVKENADGISYIKNLGYNNIIEPGSTISFGYALYNATGIPDDIAMCQKRVTKESGFDVVLNVLDSWEDNFKGEITIQNNTDSPIECWELSFDSNFTIVEITDSWAANISNYDDGKYTLKGTYTNVIYANSSVTLGFMGIKSGEPEIFDYLLTEVAADEISIPEKKEPDDSDDPYVHVDDMYYKPILSNDDVDYDGKGIYFVRNQVLVTAYQNVPFDEVKKLAEKYDAEIVGYIWLTNDYQLEFKTDVSTEYLYQQIEKFLNEPLIEYASLNIALNLGENDDSEEVVFPRESDIKEFGPFANKDEEEKFKKDITWHFEAINVKAAWKKYYNKMSEVKLGVIDRAFYRGHIDLNDNFVKGKMWENPDNAYGDVFEHGTHVAGIMAAEFNNGIGISGICPKNSLYAYSVYPIIRKGVPEKVALMQFKIAFATLIVNNVKVINISLSDDDEICIGASNGNENALNYMNTCSTSFGKFLQKIINLEYDFIIVSTAGNTNDDEYSKNDNAPYGFEKRNGGNMTGAKSVCNSFWNYIGCNNSEFEDVMNRIIVVGSIGRVNNDEDNKSDEETDKLDKANDKPVEEEYKYSEFSNYGSRVDIVAPGENIFSTVNPSSAQHTDDYANGYKFNDGTSMAAPQVSGVAGMIYSLKPGLKADKVKEIIIESAKNSERKITYTQPDKYGVEQEYTVYLLDAKAALDKAKKEDADDAPDETNKAIIYGTVVYENEEPAENINICAESKDTSEKYYFNTDEDGNYVMALEPGKYKILFSNIKYITDDYDFLDWIITYLLNHNPEYAFHIIEEKEIDANTAYELDRVLNNNESKSVDIIDYYGKELVGIEMEIRDAASNKTYITTTINNNVFKYADLKDGEYTISVSKPGYVSFELKATAKDGILYDMLENILEQIVLKPIESTITGRVTERNTTTQKIKPIAGYTVNILQDGEVIASGVTDSDGSYKIVIDAYGDIIVAFGDDERPIYAAGEEYEVNKEFLTDDNDDDDDDNDDDNNNNDKDNNTDPDNGDDNNNKDTDGENNGDNNNPGGGTGNNDKDSGNGDGNNGDDSGNGGSDSSNDYITGAPGRIVYYARVVGTSNEYYKSEVYECTSIEIMPVRDHYGFKGYFYHYISYDTNGKVRSEYYDTSTILSEIDSPTGDLPPYDYDHHRTDYIIIEFD